METNKIIWGDCTLELKNLPDESVDAIITDPPYELGFMGKSWDGTGIANDVNMWKECLRVLKSGGYLLSFGGTRTYHRMACAIEDAGFEIRDMIEWVYGSGFPKSLNIGKQIDKNYNKNSEELIKFGELIKEYRNKINISQRELGIKIGVSRELINLYEIKGNIQQQFPTKELWIKIKEELKITNDKDYIYEETEREIVGKGRAGFLEKNDIFELDNKDYGNYNLTKSKTPEGKEWEGWGTALKPAHEPIVVARKPLAEKTVAQQVLKNGCGGINIDESRVGFKDEADEFESKNKNQHSKYPNSIMRNPAPNGIYHQDKREPEDYNAVSRFPANLIHDGSDEVLKEFPNVKTGKINGSLGGFSNKEGTLYGSSKMLPVYSEGFVGSSARFFKTCPFELEDYAPFYYTAKASKSERNFGLKEGRNIHPTIKPLKLMEYLIKLVSREEAIILDPFLGSGTTAIACLKTNRQFIGIEKEDEYIKIAEARIKPYLEQTKLISNSIAPEVSGS